MVHLSINLSHDTYKIAQRRATEPKKYKKTPTRKKKKKKKKRTHLPLSLLINYSKNE